VSDLFIDPNLRGQGYGRRMIQQVAELAKQQDCLRRVGYQVRQSSKKIVRRVGRVQLCGVPFEGVVADTEWLRW
jgi:GNAT superfamily N-acetyltransferase